MTHDHQLSEREKDVVTQLLEGKSNKLIARSLGISDRTVEFHLKNVYAKLHVRSRVELILKLGNATGAAITEQLGSSTVDIPGENAENSDEPNAQMDWATSVREPVASIGKESEVKNRWTFYISNAVLWAAAIMAAAIVGAPTVLSTVLLPALAVALLFVAEPKFRSAENDG